MKSFITASLVLATAILPALPSFALDSAGSAKFTASTAQSCSGQRCGGEHRLNLSDNQLEQLNTIKTQFRASTAPKVAELHTLRHQLFDDLSKPNVSKSDILSVQTQINGLQADIGNAKANMLADSSGVFTPEQREQLRHRFLERGAMGHRHGHGHFGHSGPQTKTT